MIPDPDLGRDRTTQALGRRDWGWFHPAEGASPAHRQAGQEPWGSTRRVTAHDRHDRTLGIPDRNVPMWPAAPAPLASPYTAIERAEATCDELIAACPTARPWPALPACVAVLSDVAPAVAGRNPAIQQTLIAAIARRHRLDPALCRDLAVGVGSLVARTTHQRAGATSGSASLNMLADARIEPATQLFLARENARHAQAISDPDLPRLWLLANGLANGTPARVMRRVPARSCGPAARIVPAHDDLVGWDGIGAAVTHLRHVVTAAAEGGRWLRTAAPASPDELALAVGVVSLTEPATATALARRGPTRLRHVHLAEHAGDPPRGVLDLSDTALKAVCDRNGWLLGSPAERTARELIERRTDPNQAAAASRHDDVALDAAAYRKNPPAADVNATHRLLREAGREALRRFAGVDPPVRADLADAIAHRFPARAQIAELREAAPTRLLARIPAQPSPHPPQTLDLGL